MRLTCLAVIFLGSGAAIAGVQNGFTDHGVGAKVAECRGVVTTRDANLTRHFRRGSLLANGNMSR